jgi:hypothetical protein
MNYLSNKKHINILKTLIINKLIKNIPLVKNKELKTIEIIFGKVNHENIQENMHI